jgi:hypothetical protein
MSVTTTSERQRLANGAHRSAISGWWKRVRSRCAQYRIHDFFQASTCLRRRGCSGDVGMAMLVPVEKVVYIPA